MNTVAPGPLAAMPEHQLEHICFAPLALPFDMVRLGHARLALKHPDLMGAVADAQLLERFGWHIPRAGLPLDAERRTFFAERYGGFEIGFNGGGVRGAVDRDWVIKGIGMNLLSGFEPSDLKRRFYGRVTLDEALEEAIWGEVCHLALPCGAARVGAIVATGEDGLAEYGPADRCAITAMSVRQFAWRPAHFIRAPFFRPHAEHAARISSDVQRTRLSLALLHRVLPAPAAMSAGEWLALDPVERLLAGLEEMTRRFAEQMAAACAKRLMHGTLTDSNVCLDGAWIDFYTASSLPGYGRVKSYQSLWTEHQKMSDVFNSLAFNLRKYPPAATARLAQAAAHGCLAGRYLEHYRDALARRFVTLCGYPTTLVDALWRTQAGRAAVRALAEILMRMARAGHDDRLPHDGYPGADARFGLYPLGCILTQLALAARRSALASLQLAGIDDPALRETLPAAYRKVLRLAGFEAQRHGVGPARLHRLMTVNAQRFARNEPLLHRPTLWQVSSTLANDTPDMAEYRVQAEGILAFTRGRTRMLLADCHAWETTVWSAADSDIVYCARSDALLLAGPDAGVRRRLADLGAGSWNADLTEQRAALRAYWADAYEEMFE